MARPTDIRLQIDFLNHPKFIKLSRMYGVSGIVGVLLLWCHAAAYKTNGVLADMDEEEILIVCKQPDKVERGGEAISNPFVQELVSPIKLLDKDEDGTFIIHDWDEWQPWVAESRKRSEAGKKGAQKRWGKNGEKKALKENSSAAVGYMADDSSANSIANENGNAPFHSLPFHKSPLLPKEDEGETVSVARIVELWTSTLYDLAKPKMGKALEKKIKARIGEEPERIRGEWWEELFLHVSRCPDLMGMGARGWKASLSWVVDKKNLEKIVTGYYQEAEEAQKIPGWSEEEYEALYGKMQNS